MKRIFTSFLFLTMCVLMGFAQTLKLNGVDQYMAIPNDAAFFPETGGGYTVTFKVKLDQYLTNNARFIGARTYQGSTSNSSTTGYEIWGAQSADNFMAANFSLENSAWGHGCAWANSGVLGEFVHVAFVVRPANKETAIYINGKQKINKPDNKDKNLTNTPWGNHGKDILVGAGWQEAKTGDAITGESFPGYFANCEIDDVHFYNIPLNKDGLKVDMNNFASTAKGLVAAYDFENVQGTTVPDVSGLGHDGQLFGYEVAPKQYAVSKKLDDYSKGYILMEHNGNMLYNGNVVDAGAEVELSAFPADGYELDYFTANDNPIEGSTYVVNENTQFGGVFKEMAVEPIEPTEPTYATVHDGYNTRNRDNRLFQTLTITGGDAPYSEDFKYAEYQNGWGGLSNQTDVYQDRTVDENGNRTTNILNVTGGQEINVNWTWQPGKETNWVCFYFYIDYNHDGVFNETNELVSYNYFGSDVEPKVGVDSKGNQWNENDAVGNAHGTCFEIPSFIVESLDKDVTTRMRFKADWNSKDPLGRDGSSNTINANNGTIADFLVTVHAAAPAVKEYAVNFIDRVEGGSIKVMNGETEIVPGEKVAEGTVLTIVPTAQEGFQFSGYIINEGSEDEQYGEAPFEGPITFTVNSEINLSVYFGAALYTITLVQPENGTVAVTYPYGDLENQSTVGHGEEITIVATPADGYELESYLVNGVAQAEDKVTVTSDVTISATFKVQEVTPVEPEYTYPTESDNNRVGNPAQGTNSGSRLVYGVTVNGATVNGEAAPFTCALNNRYGSQDKVYMDKTAETVELTAGDNITVEMEHAIEWMHGYLYIDYNHDGIFNEENELVSYSFFSAADNEDGVNSLGEAKKNNCGIALPAFTVASIDKDVKTRMRLKIDWNSKNPNGNEKQPIGVNCGTIVDFTANIHKGEVAPVQKFAVTVQEPYMTDGFFTVMNGETEVKGENVMIEEGTVLTLSSVAAEGKELVAYQVNGTDIEGNTVTVDQDMVLSAKFARKQVVAEDFKVTYSCTEGGTVSVQANVNNLIRDVQSGDVLPNGTTMTVTMMPESGMTPKISVNGVDKSSDMVFNEGWGGFFPDFYEYTFTNEKGDVDIVVEYTDGSDPQPQPEEKVTLTYSLNPATAGSILVRDASAQVIESGSEIVKGTQNTLVTISVNKGYSIKSVLINDVESKDLFNEVMTGTFSYYIPVIESNTTIAVELEKPVSNPVITSTVTPAEGGYVTVYNNGQEVESGAEVPMGQQGCYVSIHVNKGYAIQSVLVNGVESKDQFSEIMEGLYGGYNLPAVTEDINIEVTFEEDIATGIGSVSFDEAGYNGATGKISVPAGAYAVVYAANGRQVMTVEGGQEVSTSELTTGAYIVRIANASAVKVIKFIKK